MSWKLRISLKRILFKKYSSRFITLKLNHCSHADYFNVFTYFLGLEKCNDVAAFVRFRYLSDLIKNILICIPKMNKGLMGVERHKGE